MSNETDEQAAALAELKHQMSEVKALKQSVPPDEVENAVTAIAEFLRTCSDTGGVGGFSSLSGAFGIRITSSISTTLHRILSDR
jgi:hypothetical protein